jgi:NhaA family Na+:H+ antiporter
LFYGGTVNLQPLLLSILLSGVLVLMGRLRVQSILPYAAVGVLLWIAVVASGIHATLAGVVIGLALPAAPRRAPRDVLDDLDVAVTSLRRDCDRHGVAPDGAIAAIERHLEQVTSPLDRVMHRLHGVVAFGVVPLFALANAGVLFGAGTALASTVTLGTFFGLSVGKPAGVLGATWLATRLGLAQRPVGATWVQLGAASLLAGIGFTMSLLVGNLGLGATRGLEDQAKLGVLAASVLSACLGLLLLYRFSPISSRRSEHDLPVVLDVPRFARGYGVRHCNVAGPLIGQSLGQLDVRRRFDVTVIGMWRAGTLTGSRNLEPIAVDYSMNEGDLLLVAGADEAVDTFLAFVHPDRASVPESH